MRDNNNSAAGWNSRHDPYMYLDCRMDPGQLHH